MSGPVVYTPEMICEAIRTHHGLLAQAARALGCNRTTIYRAMEAHPEVAACVAECREVVLDEAEGALYTICKDPENKAHFDGLRLLLRTVGRSRGYGDHSSVEVSGPAGGPIQTAAVDPRSLSDTALAELLAARQTKASDDNDEATESQAPYGDD